MNLKRAPGNIYSYFLIIQPKILTHAVTPLNIKLKIHIFYKSTCTRNPYLSKNNFLTIFTSAPTSKNQYCTINKSLLYNPVLKKKFRTVKNKQKIIKK